MQRIGIVRGNVRATVRAILDEVMTEEVRKQFNRDGKNAINAKVKKKSFGATNLYKCVIGKYINSDFPFI